MKRIIVPSFALLLLFASLAPTPAQAQKKLWSDRLIATNQFLQQHMWNESSGNFVRRSDAPMSAGSDAWGITIVLDAYAYMVEEGFMKADEMKRYFNSSSALYEKSDGDHGARVLGRQGSQTYIGGDDDLQWIAALVHCYQATKDIDYLNTARHAFNALIALGFWKDAESKGWAWNSNDQRPNGVSTAYGALAAARLFAATGDPVFKRWAAVSLNALYTPQVGFFPRDMMVASNAALTIYTITKDPGYLTRAKELAKRAASQSDEILAGKRTGERNPTDVADLAEGYFTLYGVTKDKSFETQANKILGFFFHGRSNEDISARGFFSRYDTKGQPDLNGAYLGVPLTVQLLPEVAEMLKLCAVAYRYQ